MALTDRKYRRWLTGSALVGAMVMLGPGCGSGTQTAEQALERQYKDNPQVVRVDLAKFAGTVTNDGQPPAKGTVFLVILNDPKKPTPKNRPRLYTVSTPEGTFEFSTRLKGDGTLPGSYIVTFAQLHPHGRRGFFSPDELKNLYNDPDKNAQKPEFRLDLAPPGRTDYTFDLKVAGQEPVTTPGPHAITEVH
jgi:hypothetical protein